MKRRAMLAAVTMAACLGALAACRSRAGTELAVARADHLSLQRRFAELGERDPVVAEALQAGGDVVLGLRPGFVEGVLREVAARYLDRVVLDLPLRKQVGDSGEVRVKTFLGRIDAGTWTVQATIHRVQGRLRARAPEVSSAPGNALRLDLPVDIEEGHGAATVRFEWDGRTLANVVCRDFEVTRRLQGRVLSGGYVVSGAFELSAGAERLRAEPRFPPREFRIRLDLSRDSWNEVKSAIDEQDHVLRCGLGLDDDELLERLRRRLQEGFDVKLPRALFRPVDFPAAVRQSTTIEDRRVDLAVKTRGLVVTPTAVWYSADVRTRIGSEDDSRPAPAASPRAPS